MRPLVSLYLATMGGVILWKALRGSLPQTKAPKHVAALGLCGGLRGCCRGWRLGAIGGVHLGGPGTTARLAIGSTNAAEFLLTTTISATFVMTVGLELWPVIAGLVLGGVLAAPLAAYATRWLPERWLMLIVGAVIVLLSLREVPRIWNAFAS
jgi:uncharacterized membrane protein YfcA